MGSRRVTLPSLLRYLRHYRRGWLSPTESPATWRELAALGWLLLRQPRQR